MAQPDPLFILPVLVGGTMWLSQKLLTPARPKNKKKSGNDQEDMAAQMQQSMQVTMPLMFGFFALNFPAGLSVYFVVSNLISIIQGYFMRRNREALQAEKEAASGKNASKGASKSSGKKGKKKGNS